MIQNLDRILYVVRMKCVILKLRYNNILQYLLLYEV